VVYQWFQQEKEHCEIKDEHAWWKSII